MDAKDEVAEKKEMNLAQRAGHKLLKRARSMRGTHSDEFQADTIGSEEPVEAPTGEPDAKDATTTTAESELTNRERSKTLKRGFSLEDSAHVVAGDDAKAFEELLKSVKKAPSIASSSASTDSKQEGNKPPSETVTDDAVTADDKSSKSAELAVPATPPDSPVSSILTDEPGEVEQLNEEDSAAPTAYSSAYPTTPKSSDASTPKVNAKQEHAFPTPPESESEQTNNKAPKKEETPQNASAFTEDFESFSAFGCAFIEIFRQGFDHLMNCLKAVLRMVQHFGNALFDASQEEGEKGLEEGAEAFDALYKSLMSPLWQAATWMSQSAVTSYHFFAGTPANEKEDTPKAADSASSRL